MAAVTTALAVGAVAAGAYQAKRAGDEASRAASKQAAAAQSAEALQWEMYQQSREDLAPWREAGEEALGEYQSLLEGGISQYEMSDAGQAQADYMAELTASAAAAQGQFQSERTPLSIAASRYGIQQEEYRTRLSDYAQLSGAGQSAAVGQAAAAQQYSAMGTERLMQEQNLALAQQTAATQRQQQMIGAIGGIGGAYMGYQMAPSGMGMSGAMSGAQMGQSLASLSFA